jgi:hypothetical protein
MNRPFPWYFLPLVLASAPAWRPLCAQEPPRPGPATPDAPPPPAAVVQETIRTWVETKRLASEEASAWEAEKESLAALNEIRSTEISRLDEVIAAAGTRLRDAETERDRLREEKAELAARRKALETGVASVEKNLREALPMFPQVLRDKVSEAARRLEEPAPDATLQDRWRDALHVLGEANRFQRAVTVTTELRELDGKTVEVDVVYLGWSQAWYADRSGRHAGSGSAGPEGWTWQADASVHGRVRELLAIHRKEQVPGFVTLPFAARP